MKRSSIWMLFVTLSSLVACSKLDNYGAPTGTIFGQVIDSVTNQPILTEQPSGFQIRYIEQNYKNPNVGIQNFSGKADGTFEKAYVFPATYKVLPVEGAFFPIKDTANVAVPDNGRAEVNFKVMPYLHLTASAVVVDNKIAVTYQLTRGRVGDKIVERKSLVSVVPTVSNTVWFKNAATNVSGVNDDVILSTTYTDTIRGLEPGTYYVRAAARTANAYSRFNYSPILEISVP